VGSLLIALIGAAVLAAAPLASPPGTLVVQANGVAPELSLAKASGASGARVIPNLGWFGTEPVVGNGYDWSTPDSTQRAVDAAGLENFRVLLSNRRDDPGKPACATDPGTMFLLSPSFRAPWQSFVRAAVERYDGDGIADMPGLVKPVKRWSYTPEVGTYFCPQGDVTGFATMFQLTADAVHSADPSAEILLPLNTQGVYLCAFADGYLGRDTIAFQGQTLTRSQVSTLYAQNISYTKGILGAIRPDAYDLHLYGDADQIPQRKKWLLDYVKSQGLPEKPVYAMEGGEPFADLGERFPGGPSTCTGAAEDAARLAFQSGAVVRHVTLALSSGYGVVTWNLFSEYGNYGTSFGELDFLDACGRTRPAYATWTLTASKLVPFASAGEVAGAPGGVRVFRFTFASKPDVWVAWEPAAPAGTLAAHDLSGVLPFASAMVTHAVTTTSVSTPVVTTEATVAVSFGATPVFVENSSPQTLHRAVPGPGLPVSPRPPRP
jgi:hypothetical protein